MDTISAYIADGYSLTFTKNLIVMKFQNYEKSDTVDSAVLHEVGGDIMLHTVLERLKFLLDSKSGRVKLKTRNRLPKHLLTKMQCASYLR